MAKISLQILLIASISSFIFFFNSDSSKSCSFGPDPDDYYNLFDKELIKVSLFEPFYLSEMHFHPYDNKTPLNERTANILEWREYFDNAVKTEDIDLLIYSSTQSDISEFAKFLNHEKNTLKQNLKSNSLVKMLKKNQNKDFVDYLSFAKSCETQVQNYDVSWEESLQDTIAMRELIKTGLSFYEKSSDDYIKLRYAFQIVRLAHYLDDYNLGLNLYDKLTSALNVKSIINYWLLSHKAGMLKLTGKSAEGNYLFSRIFDECPSRRLTAANNFKTPNPTDINAVVNLAKTDREKEAIWFLYDYKNNWREYFSYSPERGYYDEPLQKLYSINPHSKYLELCLFRTLIAAERRVLPDKYYYYNYISEVSDSAYISDFSLLYKTINKISIEEKTEKPYLWHFASGYLSMLFKKSESALVSFEKAEKLWLKNDPLYLDRLKICKILNKIELAKKLDKDFEKDILPDMNWLNNYSGLNSKDGMVYLYYKLYSRYKAEGNNLYANLCLGNFNSGYDIESNPFNYPVDEIYNLMNGTNQTDFENFLLQNYKYNISDLLEIQGTKFLAQFNFEEAIQKFESMKSSTISLPADPFLIHIKDCHDCDFLLPKEITYTKLSFAKRMVELKKLAETDKKKAAEYYFLLANGYYNLTHFGNSWMAADYYHDPNIVSYLPYNKDNYYFDLGEFVLLDCSKAKEYYQKALSLTKNNELAAECCFMAAKCEQNDYYINPNATNVKVPLEYRTHFIKLMQNYSETKFFKEALKECKYFNYFVTHN